MFRLRRACVRPVNGSPSDLITVRTPFVVEFEYWKLVPHIHLELSADVYNEHGVHLFTTDMFGDAVAPASLLRSWFVVPGDLLNDGTHRIHLGFYRDRTILLLRLDDLLTFNIHDASDLRGAFHDVWSGAVRPYLEWKTEQIDSSWKPTDVFGGQS